MVTIRFYWGGSMFTAITTLYLFAVTNFANTKGAAEKVEQFVSSMYSSDHFAFREPELIKMHDIS